MRRLDHRGGRPYAGRGTRHQPGRGDGNRFGLRRGPLQDQELPVVQV